MFERYTESARRVLFFARYEAGQRGSVSVAPEHLLLGLIREGQGVVSRIFRDAHLSREHVLERIDHGGVVPEPIVADAPDIPFNAEAKRIFQGAAEEADRLLQNDVGAEHLLLGILREERSVAASLLLAHGLRLDTVRDEIVLRLHEATMFPPPRTGKPNLPPSNDVHISPTTRREDEGTLSGAAADYWMRLGCELRPIIAEVYGVDESRIECPFALDQGARYDFVVVLPQEERQGTIEGLVQRAIEKYFRLVITRETRSLDVYVVTAPGGVNATELLELGGGGSMTGFREFQVDTRIRPLPAISELMRDAVLKGECGVFGSGTTIADFCKSLEQTLGRTFVDETGLTGLYDRLELRANGESVEDVLQALGDQLGLVATPERREVAMLVVRQSSPPPAS